jgi:hypothetical protein
VNNHYTKLLFQDWAAEIAGRPNWTLRRFIVTVSPHLTSPDVSATFRGPNWGKR